MVSVLLELRAKPTWTSQGNRILEGYVLEASKTKGGNENGIDTLR